MFDAYAHLNDARTEYICIEDTGKLWPTLDVKVSFITASGCLRRQLELIHQDFLLNVSPFASLLIKEYCSFSASNDFATVRQLIQRNRTYLRDIARANRHICKLPFPESRISVEMLELCPVQWTSETIRRVLLTHGIGVLGARGFFWETPALGDHYIRVALARDCEYFIAAVRKTFEVLQLYLEKPEDLKSGSHYD